MNSESTTIRLTTMRVELKTLAYSHIAAGNRRMRCDGWQS